MEYYGIFLGFTTHTYQRTDDQSRRRMTGGIRYNSVLLDCIQPGEYTYFNDEDVDTNRSIFAIPIFRRLPPREVSVFRDCEIA
jgi:hypothetical protein